MITDSFKKVSIKGASCKEENLLHVNNVLSFVQGIGYIKFLLAQKGYGLAFRGSKKIYESVTPSLYHNVKNMEDYVNKNDENTNLEDQIQAQAKKHYKALYPAYKDSFFEIDKILTFPLLQHYGIETEWLDLVDNIWVALWFASHVATTQMVKHKNKITFSDNDQENCYIYLIRTPLKHDCISEQPGIYKNSESILMDLRCSIPSYFLRPHIQHGLLLKKNYPYVSDGMWLMDDFVEGIIEIETSTALEILGNGKSFLFDNFFPTEENDPGLKKLLAIQCIKEKIQQNII